MDRVIRAIERRARRARTVEPFVRWIVGGGVALVAGLWIATLASTGSLPWILGAGLVLLGVAGLARGIRSQVAS